MKIICNIIIALFLILTTEVFASGGPLSPQQAAYDVNYYELDLKINPATRTIEGSLLCRVRIVNSIDTLVLDLDNVFTIDSILFRKEDGEFSSASFSHSAGRINITIPVPVMPEDMISAKIFYRGAPRVAATPPWSSGFVWRTTPTGKPWLGVTVEMDGADIWWPCKDHPSDEPDSMYMSYTVPNPLICVSNGRFVSSVDNGDGTSTFNWFISTPINNYNVSFYAAEYQLIEDQYLSVTGDSIPFYFWVIPESYNQALNMMNVFRNEFDFLESICGPFPFSTDKHGWAHSPYYGMEHQTIIAYGNNFSVNGWGFDYIHLHELAHEWWGNLVTAKDWSDVWIHEGIGTYTEALYVEATLGFSSYLLYMNNQRPSDNHSKALAPREQLTAMQGFALNPYSRGSSVMHTLRYHLGDEKFFNLLKRWAYPDSTDYDNTNGRLCRIASTDDMKNLAEEITGVELDPFFEVFFRDAAFPKLKVVRGSDHAVFTWQTQTNVPLDLNIPLLVNGIEMTVEMDNGTGTAPVKQGDNLVIDPKKWILMGSISSVVGIDGEEAVLYEYSLSQNYPNPFNPNTVISFSVTENQNVELRVYDLLGNMVAELVNGYREAGNYSVNFNADKLPSGIYFYEIKAGSFRQTNKMIFLK
jgi:aminopeptidase N